MLAETLALALAAAAPCDAQEPRTEIEVVDGWTIERQVHDGAGGAQVLHGGYTLTDPDGRTRVQGEHVDGKREGLWRYRYADGTLAIKAVYRSGVRDGKWSFDHPDGSLRAEGRYDEGLKRGHWEMHRADDAFDESGVREQVAVVPRTGRIGCEGTLVEGRMHGAWRFTWPDGRPMLEAEYAQGRRTGSWRFTHIGGVPDALLLTGELGPGTLDALVDLEPPVPELWGGPEILAPRESAPTAPAEEPPLPAIEPPAEELGREARDRVRLSMEALVDAAQIDPDAAAARIVEEGPLVIPLALDQLTRLDLASSPGAAAGMRLSEHLLRRLFGGRSFGWRLGVGPQDIAANRLAVRRWIALWNLIGTHEEVWALDLLPARGAADGELDTALRFPRFEANLELDAARSTSPPPRFAARFGPRKELRRDGGAGTEAAVADALAWLAGEQHADGSWAAKPDEQVPFRGHDDIPPGADLHTVGRTALALLALMGDGNTVTEGQYAGAVMRGVRFLLEFQDSESGGLYLAGARRKEDGGWIQVLSHHWFFDHALATQALCEAATTSSSPGLRAAARAAFDALLRAQNPYGAWRYDSPPTGDNDTAATGFAVEALAAGRAAGFPWERASRGNATTWFEEVTDAATGRVGYEDVGSHAVRYAGLNDHMPAERVETPTAIGIRGRLLTGQDVESAPILIRSADLMLRSLPEWDDDGHSNDLVYWLFGSLALYELRGELPKHWKAWNMALKKALLDSQRKDGAAKGSWDPIGPWGRWGGRVYATAMGALSLQSYYRFRAEDAVR